MNCNEFQDLITAEIDGELAEEFKSPLQEHLKNCANCRGEYDLELSTKAFLRRRLKRAETPAPLRQQITAELAAMAPEPPFGESYGFVAADDVLRAVSVMITNTLRELSSADDFRKQADNCRNGGGFS